MTPSQNSILCYNSVSFQTNHRNIFAFYIYPYGKCKNNDMFLTEFDAEMGKLFRFSRRLFSGDFLTNILFSLHFDYQGFFLIHLFVEIRIKIAYVSI